MFYGIKSHDTCSNAVCQFKLQHVFDCCLSALTQSHNRFATRLFPKSMILSGIWKAIFQGIHVSRPQRKTR